MQDEMLTKTEVLGLLKISRASLYRLMQTEHFPVPVKFGQRSNRWRSSEVLGWIENRPRAALRS